MTFLELTKDEPKQTKKMSANSNLPSILIASIGIVYGDIGTSPLYALKSCFNIGNLVVNEANVFGIISLFIWSLITIVSFKYINLILKMNHQGEGGILALSTLVAVNPKFRLIATSLGIIGASLFFGDGVITPAISVLSAVEGLAVIDPHLSNYIIPITILILTCLFSIQKFGSSKIGSFFGPIMIIWFTTLFILGICQIYKYPLILKALNPYHAFSFLSYHSLTGLLVMGGVILVITGVEALYADLGHFGKRPIKLSWNYFILPCLCCNYLGQGSLLLTFPDATSNPFYFMVPGWALYSLILLATFATIIASQSVLSGLFSITYHSILLNYFPRLKVKHTSENFKGQIYIPAVNFFIYILTIGAVLKFNSSEKLAAVYGLCVASIMIITTTLTFLLVKNNLKWSNLKIICIFVPLFFIDLIFVAANFLKFFIGAGYIIIITGCIYYCVYVWRKGSKALEKQKIIIDLPIEQFIKKHLKVYSHKIPGVALFMCREPFKVPNTLFVNLQHNKYLHEKIVFIAFKSLDTPYFKATGRFSIDVISKNIFQVIIKSGFMERPNINKLLNWLEQKSILDDRNNVSIFISKGVPVKTKDPILSGFSETLYFYLSSIAQSATDFYHIPHHRVVELGIRYKI